MTQFVNTQNTQERGDGNAYKNVLEKIAEDKVCPFCPEQLTLYHKNPILHENEHWLITRNMYPYKNTKNHFLLIHKNHIQYTHELSNEAQLGLLELINWAVKEFNIPGATYFMRFGDTKYTGASVSHLHAQLVSSDPTEAGYEPVVARVG